MRRFTSWFGITLALLAFTPSCLGDDKKPVWRINLSRFYAERPHDDFTIKFAGPYLVVYAGTLVYMGSEVTWYRPPLVVFDTRTGERFPKDRPAELVLPPWDDCRRTQFRKGSPELNIIDCRNQLTIEQVGGVGKGEVAPAEFYLQEPAKERVLIFRAHKKCQPGDPRFISDELILLWPCNNNVVVDKAGRKVYDMPRLTWYWLAVNRQGTRFAVYERDLTFFSLYTNRLRVKVFRSSDGKKLFDYRWHVDDEATNDGRIALSDDGLLLAILRGQELLVFALPPEK